MVENENRTFHHLPPKGCRENLAQRFSLLIQKANVASQALILNCRAHCAFHLTLNIWKQVFVTPQFHAEFVIIDLLQ